MDNTTIYGKDGELYISGVNRHGEDKVEVFKRHPDGSLTSEFQPFTPFAFMNEARASKHLHRTRYRSAHKLKRHARAYYDTLITFDTWSEFKSARKLVGYDHIYAPPAAEGQYLMQTGKTLYKGIEPQGHLRIMYFDIEVYSSTDYFPDAEREGDEIFIIAVTGSGGYRKVLHTGPARDSDVFVRLGDERQLIKEFVKEVHRFDPDVMAHHNGFGFDLPYLIARAERHGVNFAIGRDKRQPMAWDKKKAFADRELQFTQVIAAGRSLIDTMHMALNFDTFKREFSSYGLKYLADYFGVSSADRTYIPGDEIADTWDRDPNRVLDYALDDAVETAGIYKALGASLHEMTKALPMTMQGVQQTGQASRIESLFVREYLRRGVALPKPEGGKQSGGGYTNLFWRGVFENCVYEDVASLYPAIMRHWDIQPAADTLGVFSFGIDFFTQERLRMKAEMKREDNPARKQLLDAKQTAFKTFINSFYGSLSNKHGLFCDFSEGERVASTGRKIIKRMIQVTQQLGGRVILVDTDGAMFQPPDFDVEAVDAFIAEVSDAMPEGIEIDNDGMFRRVLSYKPKNYVKETMDGTLKFAGSSLRSRSIEPFLRDYIDAVVRMLMAGDIEAIHEHTQQLYRTIRTGRLSASDISKTQTLRKTMSEYKRDVEENENVYPSAQYEVGLELIREHDEDIRAGSRVSYYIAPGTGRQSEKARPIRLFDGQYDTAHYAKRLRRTTEKFESFFSETEFLRIFKEPEETPQVDMFADREAEREKKELATIKVRETRVEPYPHEKLQPQH